MSIIFSQISIIFAVCSILGWLLESAYRSVKERKLISSGMLRGPYCPVYGFGAVTIFIATSQVYMYPVAVFFISLVSVTIVEYLTSWLVEALFKVRLWDYSARRFNFRGRVCLSNSLIFGGLGLLMHYLVVPGILWFVGLASEWGILVSNAFIVIFILDLLLTLNRIIGISEWIKKLYEEFGEVREADGSFAWLDIRDIDASLERLKAMLEESGSENAADILRRFDSLSKVFKTAGRYGRAFPSAGDGDPSGLVRMLPGERTKPAKARKKTPKPKKAPKKQYGPAATLRRFLHSMREDFNYFNLFWVFLSASIIGYVLETVFCFVTSGIIESRQGVLYGPFCQVYGFGAVLMVLLLKPLAKKSDRWLFFGGAIVGGAFEYVCSYIQEIALGTTSWDYSEERFAIGSGRTSLTYMLMWGILGVFFIKAIYPWLRSLIYRIPIRQRNFFTIAFSIFMAANLLLSAAAVSRWAERVAGLPPDNAIEEMLDERYPDEHMWIVYPNMRFQ